MGIEAEIKRKVGRVMSKFEIVLVLVLALCVCFLICVVRVVIHISEKFEESRQAKVEKAQEVLLVSLDMKRKQAMEVIEKSPNSYPKFTKMTGSYIISYLW